MKKVGFLLLSMMLLVSCGSESDDEISEKTFTVRYEVTSNTPNEPIEIYANANDKLCQLTIKDKWTGEFVTKEYVASVYVECKNPDVLIKSRIYVNGKLKTEKEGNEQFLLSYRLKGSGPDY